MFSNTEAVNENPPTGVQLGLDVFNILAGLTEKIFQLIGHAVEKDWANGRCRPRTVIVLNVDDDVEPCGILPWFKLKLIGLVSTLHDSARFFFARLEPTTPEAPCQCPIAHASEAIPRNPPFTSPTRIRRSEQSFDLGLTMLMAGGLAVHAELGGHSYASHKPGSFAHVAHRGVDAKGLHLPGVVGPEQVHGRAFGVVSRQPPVVVGRLHDDWHAVVDRRRQLVGIGRDDGKGLQPAAVRLLPGVSYATEGERVAAAQGTRRSVRRTWSHATVPRNLPCYCPNSNADDVMHVAWRILDGIRLLARPHAGTSPGIVTVSLGVVSLVPSKRYNPEELVRKADSALYRAKRSERNCLISSTG